MGCWWWAGCTLRAGGLNCFKLTNKQADNSWPGAYQAGHNETALHDIAKGCPLAHQAPHQAPMRVSGLQRGPLDPATGSTGPRCPLEHLGAPVGHHLLPHCSKTYMMRVCTLRTPVLCTLLSGRPVQALKCHIMQPARAILVQ